ncbi:hypothetical protein ES703_35543 [subsurface metagenome]
MGVGRNTTTQLNEECTLRPKAVENEMGASLGGPHLFTIFSWLLRSLELPELRNHIHGC